MNKQKRFAEYKSLRNKNMRQKYAAQSVGISQPLASQYDKYKTYAQYQRENRARDLYYRNCRTEREINRMDTQEAYDRWVKKQDKESKEFIEKMIRATTSAKKPKKVSWRFAPKVPNWMKRFLGGK